jgi:hypothetical protein
MRVQQTVRVLTAAAAAAAVAAPTASARPNDSGGADAHPAVTVAQHNPGSDNQESIAIATGVGIAVLAGGITASRRHTRRHAPTVRLDAKGR